MLATAARVRAAGGWRRRFIRERGHATPVKAMMFAKRYERWLIPEVVQTSAMDCGPASLQSLLAGFQIPVSYERLREARQTDVDGTCIDSLEVIANGLGLHAEQIMVPLDHVLRDE